MAKKNEPQVIGHPQVTPDIGIKLLNEQVINGKKLLEGRPISSDAYSKWELITRNILEKAFGTNSPNVSSIMDVGRYGGFPLDATNEWWENKRATKLTTQITNMEGLIELLETEILISNKSHPQQQKIINGHEIFLVHGKDEPLLHESARFIEKMNQKVIILREQPNKGRTIIEKFEEYSDVGFAIVLLTDDDLGGQKETNLKEFLPRARQNVIFELGYFIGKLGRNRVCALYTEGVEIPSDYSGVVFIKIDDSGAWKLAVAKELKAANFSIDMNLAL